MFYKDEKTKASIGHCKRASQKFQRKEEPQTSQNQQETINRFLKADYKELGTYRGSYCHSIQTHPLLQLT